jgi:membrane associated rhomboid family serine protease
VTFPVAILRTPSASRCRELHLVLVAAGIPCRIRSEGPEYVLEVPENLLAPARAELEAYALESGEPPRSPPPPPAISPGLAGAFAYATLLLGIFALDRTRILGTALRPLGMLRSGAVLDGQWWRTVTALTLHADATHVAGNLVFGCGFTVLLSRSVGSGVCWALTLTAGALGNLLNCVLRGPGHAALGASTAVFGAIGILSAVEWRRRRGRERRRLRRYAPLVIGFVFLGFLGATGENVDVLAHGCGFLIGLLCGGCLARVDPDRLRSPLLQRSLAVLTVVILGLCWACALFTLD